MTRILIADHHRLVREGIARLLEGEPGLEVVAQAADADSLVASLRESCPDVVLVDVQLPPAGGLEAVRRALRARPQARCVCLGLGQHGPYPARMLEQGACGMVTKGCSRAGLLGAIRDVAEGRLHVAPELAQSLLHSGLSAVREPVDELSPRELAVLRMVSEGRRPKEISDRLCISPKTVSTYRSRVCRKLGVSNDVQLTHLSLEHGIIESGYCR